MRKHDYLLSIIASLGVLFILFGNCRKEKLDPIVGAWQIAGAKGQQGYWFYTDGLMCRYDYMCQPFPSDCKNTYSKHDDTVHITDAGGTVVTWRIEFVTFDLMRVRVLDGESAEITLFLDRDKWE